MINLRDFEHLVNNKGEVIVTEEGEKSYIFNQTHRHIVTAYLEYLSEEYPEALLALEKRYTQSRINRMYFEFLIVKMWIKLHHGQMDAFLDVDEVGEVNFEYTYCAQRGECDICNLQAACYPVRSTKLRKAEINVLRLIVSGLDEAQMADTLNISVNTVKNHRNNMLKRLDLHKTSQLIEYWNKNKMR